MNLQPRRSPGRVDRKAAGYGPEIARLRQAGYTFEAIREALADVGVELSISALRREVGRIKAVPVPFASSITRAPATKASTAMPSLARQLPARSNATGREIAEAFFSAHTSNPLLRQQERS